MKKKCPITQKACWEHGCEWYDHLIGTDPQTGAPKDEWGCSVKWLPVLMCEVSGKVRQVSAALDRNNNVLFSALPEQAQQRVMKSNSNLLNGKPNEIH